MQLCIVYMHVCVCVCCILRFLSCERRKQRRSKHKQNCFKVVANPEEANAKNIPHGALRQMRQ